jgi:hypothetical protein
MQLIMKGEGVDIDATFQLLDKRISALEPKDKPSDAKGWTPAPPKGASKTEQPKSAWKPEPPKRA